MNGYGFLIISLVLLIGGVGLYNARPLLDRWIERLDRDIARMKQGH